MDGRTRPLDGLWVTLTSAFAIFIAVAPIGASTNTPAGPHWLFIVLGYWCSRLPNAVAPMIVFGLGLLNDMLRTGPVGAELFALLIACEALRSFSERRPPITWMTEWLRFTAALLVLEGLVWLMLAATYARTPSLVLLAQHVGLTILAYPIVAYGLEKVFGANSRRFSHLR